MNSSPTNAFGRQTLASQIAGRAGDVFGKRAWKITPPRDGGGEHCCRSSIRNDLRFARFLEKSLSYGAPAPASAAASAAAENLKAPQGLKCSIDGCANKSERARVKRSIINSKHG